MLDEAREMSTLCHLFRDGLTWGASVTLGPFGRYANPPLSYPMFPLVPLHMSHRALLSKPLYIGEPWADVYAFGSRPAGTPVA